MKNNPKDLSKGKEIKTRHDKTQMVIKATIGDMISNHAADGERMRSMFVWISCKWGLRGNTSRRWR